MSWAGIDIQSEWDIDDALELRPGEFYIVFIDRRAGELGVARSFEGRAEQVGPMEHFRRRGGESRPEYFDIGCIVTRVRG